MQLCGDESKGSTVVFVMTKNGHAAVKVGHSLSVAAKTQRGGDFSRTAGKQEKVQLGHGGVELAGGNPILALLQGYPVANRSLYKIRSAAMDVAPGVIRIAVSH